MKASIGDQCYPVLKAYPVPLVISTLGGRMDLWVLNGGLESLGRKDRASEK